MSHVDARLAVHARRLLVERVMTDNHYSYTRARAVAQAMTALHAKHVLIRPHCTWQNGKVERFNRTPGSSTTTPKDATQLSEANPRPAD